MAQITIISADSLLAAHWKTILAREHSILVERDWHEFSKTHSKSESSVLIIDGETIKLNFSDLNYEITSRFKILIIGKQWSDQQQVHALVSGCSGYCDLSLTDKLLCKAVNRLLLDDIWIQRHLVPQIIRTLSELSRSEQPTYLPNNDFQSEKLKLLSNREIEVASLIKIGESNKNIAARLKISERTVKAHLTSIFNKLEIKDRLHLAIFLKEISEKSELAP